MRYVSRVQSPYGTNICTAYRVVPGLAVCVFDFAKFLNAPTIQELFLVRIKKKKKLSKQKSLDFVFTMRY